MEDTALSKNGISIRLPEERWLHISEQHPELAEYRNTILSTIEEPDRILAGNNGELMAVRLVDVGKWLVVVYREFEEDGLIITAFFTRRHRSLDRRTLVWSASNNT